MKKIFAGILVLAMCFGLAGCGNSGAASSEAPAATAAPTAVPTATAAPTAAPTPAAASPESAAPAAGTAAEGALVSKTLGGMAFYVPKDWVAVEEEADLFYFYPEPIDGNALMIMAMRQGNPGISLKGNEQDFFTGYASSFENYVAGDTETTEVEISGETYTLSVHYGTLTYEDVPFESVVSVFDTGADFFVFAFMGPQEADTSAVFAQYTDMVASCQAAVAV